MCLPPLPPYCSECFSGMMTTVKSSDLLIAGFESLNRRSRLRIENGFNISRLNIVNVSPVVTSLSYEASSPASVLKVIFPDLKLIVLLNLPLLRPSEQIESMISFKVLPSTCPA